MTAPTMVETESKYTMDESSLKQMVVDFFSHADNSVPLLWFLPIVADDFFGFWTPTCQFQGHVGFEELYRSLTTNQFDRHHEVSNIRVKMDGNTADITFDVHLTARWWQPPLPKSMLVENMATFNWLVKPSPKNGGAQIKDYKLVKVHYTADSILQPAEAIFKYPQYVMGPFTFPPEQ